MSVQTIESLCSINPESLGAATPATFTFDYIDISAVSEGRIAWGQVRRFSYGEAPSRARRCLRNGDVLLCTVRPGLKAHARIVGENSTPLVGSTGFAVMRPNDPADSSFIFHQLFTNEVAGQLRAMEVGSNYPAVNERDVRRIHFFTPDPADRGRIAAVLDAVKAAIAKTEAVIAKLNQVRAGLVHDLLARGLDHNGELRDPLAHPEHFANPPIGRIPTNWSVRRLGEVLGVVFDYRGRTPLKLGMEWGGGDIPALSANNVEMGRINFERETYLGSPSLYERWMTHGHTEQGDVLITMEAPLGNIAQIPDDKKYILSQRVVLLRPKPEILRKDFLALQMTGARFQKELVRNSTGTTAVGIQRAKLETIEVLIPDTIDEQDAIARVARFAAAVIETSILNLGKLRQLKSAVMSDLLTGRVRVPETIELGAV